MYNEFIKKVNTIDLGKQNLEKKKYEEVDKKISDTSKFIVTQDFNMLTKINFNASKTKAEKHFQLKKSRECT